MKKPRGCLSLLPTKASGLLNMSLASSICRDAADSLDPRRCLRQRRLVKTTSARAGAAVLEQGGAMAARKILENHVASPVGALEGLVLHDAGERPEARHRLTSALNTASG